jgi:hypothetical protein
MAKNFLEQLIAEWYEFQGYVVIKNVLVGRLPHGGHEGELDIVAFHPGEEKIIHIEACSAADSWKSKENRFKKKFDAGKKHIPILLRDFKIPKVLDQIAVLAGGSKRYYWRR